MELTWLDPDNLDTRAVAGAVAVLDAANTVDTPHMLSPTASAFEARIRHGWDDDPPLAAVARDDTGRVVGVLQVWLSHWDNTHTGSVDVIVDPLRRRQGIGRELFDAGVDRVRADGRSLVLSSCYDGTAGVEFLKAMGLDRALEEVLRRQDLTALDWSGIDREYAEAEPYATGYELLRLPGTTPDDLIANVVQMTEAINDAPIGDLAIEDEVFTPERVRAFEAAQVARKRRMYRVVARERATGVFAGHTVVAVENERPWQSWQYDTSVLRSHRGHRLGLLLKVDMLRWLRTEEPQIRMLDTDNAASNAHMIRINELLGYRVMGKAIEWQRHI